jgi:hypothetical protein
MESRPHGGLASVPEDEKAAHEEREVDVYSVYKPASQTGLAVPMSKRTRSAYDVYVSVSQAEQASADALRDADRGPLAASGAPSLIRQGTSLYDAWQRGDRKAEAAAKDATAEGIVADVRSLLPLLHRLLGDDVVRGDAAGALAKPLRELLGMTKQLADLKAESTEWNAQFQAALELEETSAAAATAKFARLTQLSNDFVQLCKKYGQLIISELAEDLSRKTILPRGLGGIAGGGSSLWHPCVARSRSVLGCYAQAPSSLLMAFSSSWRATLKSATRVSSAESELTTLPRQCLI